MDWFLVRPLCLVWLLCAAALASGGEPLFTFGAVSDIQYGDKETKGKRQYRQALELLPRCVEKFNAERPAFVVQCGDLYDGYEKENGEDVDREKTRVEASRVLLVLRGIGAPLYHVLGNHCLRAGKEFVTRELGRECFYYEFTSAAAKGWRFLVLDGNDAGYEIMSPEQIAWLGERLAEAAKAGERVIVFCHYALLKEAARNHRLKNGDSVLPVLEGAGCVAAWIAGHDHAGGYFERAGIHHVTLKGLVESRAVPDFALFAVFSDRIIEDGFGAEPDRVLALGAIGR